MDSQVVWSPEALEDVEREFPLSGRIVPELNQEAIRERFIYSYRLIYCIRGKTVTIVAVIHGKRLLDPIRDRIRDL